MSGEGLLKKRMGQNFDKISKNISCANLEELCRAYSKTQGDIEEMKQDFYSKVSHGHFKEDGSICKHGPYISSTEALEFAEKWLGETKTK